MERIVVATDFSPAAVAAADAAAALARRSGARLSLLHVFDPASERDPAGQRRWEQIVVEELAEQRERLGLAGVPIRPLAHPRASEAIVSFAREERADLLVLGNHGRSGLQHLVLGSVAEKVARLAECDVLVARATLDPAAFPRAIVAGTDLTPASAAAERRAAEWSARFGARLTIAHVYDDSPPLATTRSSAAQRLDKLVSKLKNDGGAAADCWRSALVIGLDPGAALCRLASEEHADVVLVGSHHRAGLARLALGSVAERVVRRAPAAALVVHSAPPARAG